MNDRQSIIAAYPMHTQPEQRSYEVLITRTLTAQAASAARAVCLLRDIGAEPEVEQVMLRYRRCLLLANGPASGDGVSCVAGVDWRVLIAQSEELPDHLSAQLLDSWQVQAAHRASREQALGVWTTDSGRSEALVAAEEYELAMSLWQGLCEDETTGLYDRRRPIQQAFEEIAAENSKL